MRVLSVVGARPNFMKLAPVHRALLERSGIEQRVVHTGQHFDRSMSDAFFEDLGIPEPHENLGVGSGSHARQTAQIMERFEPVIHGMRPDLVLVYGDVNSTVAAALVAAKLGVKVGHVEAGLRSRDWSMPEEVNRVVTDRLSDLLYTPSRDADRNLEAEGVSRERVRFIGNVMIDSLVYALPKAKALAAHQRHDVRERGYVVVTLHRPSNVDNEATLAQLIGGLGDLSQDWPVLFMVHPRTRRHLNEFGIEPEGADLHLLEPVGYLEMLSLVDRAGLVITDSGGLQEETSYLGVPCLTARPNTERPVTVEQGTNQLVPSEREALVKAAQERFGAVRDGAGIELWDGQAALRLADSLSA